tara:strand:- start:1451 stop:2227 length:777 start_codon:yes stop_codon:yes gene_type:complete
MSNFFKNFPLTSYNFTDNKNNKQVILDIFKHVKSTINLDDTQSYVYHTIAEGSRPDQVSQELYDTPDYYWTFFMINNHLINGMSSWPKEYNELQTFLKIKYPYHTLTGYRNTGVLAGEEHLFYRKNFIIGETIQGSETGYTAKIININYDMNCIKLGELTGNFNSTEQIDGLTSGAFVPQGSSDYTFSLQEQIQSAHHYEKGDEITPRIIYSVDETLLYEVTNFNYEVGVNESSMDIKVLKPQYIEDFSRTYKKLING